MLALVAIAGFMLFVTFFGKQFGESLSGVSKGISDILSPQIRPALIPTVGLEFTPGVWDWWQGAQQWWAWISGEGAFPGAGAAPPPTIIRPPGGWVSTLPNVANLPSVVGWMRKPAGGEAENVEMRAW